MVKFSTTILKFAQHADKTGWTYIIIKAADAQKLKPDTRKSFRVKGKLDAFAIKSVALMPRGNGDFIMAVNAAMRKGIGKTKGAKIAVQLQVDEAPILPPAELMECLQDEPKALKFYNSLPQGHKNYFTKWIESAKTDPTKTKRIALVINSLSKKMDFGLMLRTQAEERKKLQ